MERCEAVALVTIGASWSRALRRAARSSAESWMRGSSSTTIFFDCSFFPTTTLMVYWPGSTRRPRFMFPPNPPPPAPPPACSPPASLGSAADASASVAAAVAAAAPAGAVAAGVGAAIGQVEVRGGHGVAQLLDRRDVVEDPDRPAVRAEDQIVLAGMNGDVVDGDGRQVQAEAHPARPLIGRDEQPVLGPDEQQL